MKRICTICARGGSKGVKNKNIRRLLGKPLIGYSLEQARACQIFDVVAVSSDSKEILSIAKDYGADVLIKRPAELATDHSAKIPAIRHCVMETEQLSYTKYDIVVDLDATSPLRTPKDIQDAVSLLELEQVSNVITAAPARRSPYFNLVELNEKGIVHLAKPLKNPVVRRQDAPPCFDMNASIYVWQRQALFNLTTVFNQDTRLFVMPESRSLDIDSELDFKIVEFLMSSKKTA